MLDLCLFAKFIVRFAIFCSVRGLDPIGGLANEHEIKLTNLKLEVSTHAHPITITPPLDTQPNDKSNRRALKNGNTFGRRQTKAKNTTVLPGENNYGDLPGNRPSF